MSVKTIFSKMWFIVFILILGCLFFSCQLENSVESGDIITEGIESRAYTMDFAGIPYKQFLTVIKNEAGKPEERWARIYPSTIRLDIYKDDKVRIVGNPDYNTINYTCSLPILENPTMTIYVKIVKERTILWDKTDTEKIGPISFKPRVTSPYILNVEGKSDWADVKNADYYYVWVEFKGRYLDDDSKLKSFSVTSYSEHRPIY
jgi:hypothetical protein